MNALGTTRNYALRPVSKKFPDVAFERVPALAWPTMALSLVLRRKTAESFPLILFLHTLWSVDSLVTALGNEHLKWLSLLPFLTPLLPQPVTFRGEWCTDAPANSIFSTFSALCFDDSPFTWQCEKEDRNSSGFQILHFYWSFSSGIMAVKGLTMYGKSVNVFVDG